MFSFSFFHWCHILQSWMLMLIIIPMNEVWKPFTGFFERMKTFRLASMIFCCFEEWFNVRIVITDSWPWKAGNNSQLIIKCTECDAFHRLSVIRMNEIRMTVFLSAGCIKQFCSNFLGIFLSEPFRLSAVPFFRQRWIVHLTPVWIKADARNEVRASCLLLLQQLLFPSKLKLHSDLTAEESSSTPSS